VFNFHERDPLEPDHHKDIGSRVSNVKVSVTFNWRLPPQFINLKDLLSKNERIDLRTIPLSHAVSYMLLCLEQCQLNIQQSYLIQNNQM